MSRPTSDLYLIRPEKCRSGSSQVESLSERSFEEFWKESKEPAKAWLRQHGIIGSYAQDRNKTWMSVIDSRATVLKKASLDSLSLY